MSPYRRTLTLLAVVGLAIASCGRTAPRSSAGGTPPRLDPKAGLEPVGTTETTGLVISHKQESAAPASIGAEALLAPAMSEACPDGMILVEGEYCPDVEQKCLRWLEPPGDPYEHFRCAEYAKPAVCKGAKVHKRFCIDATERVEEGSDLPMHKKSWTDATGICGAEGARLCMTSEWQFACEGEEMRPYPYGWARDSEACNVDVMTGLGRVGKLVDHRTPASAHPRCVSPFGVHDMAGNVDEWATVDGAPRGSREVMKGSWWLPGRHACRSFQGGHGANYGGTETGVRCCKDAAAAN
jgi:sulfatase modifying factor 1